MSTSDADADTEEKVKKKDKENVVKKIYNSIRRSRSASVSKSKESDNSDVMEKNEFSGFKIFSNRSRKNSSTESGGASIHALASEEQNFPANLDLDIALVAPESYQLMGRTRTRGHKRSDSSPISGVSQDHTTNDARRSRKRSLGGIDSAAGFALTTELIDSIDKWKETTTLDIRVYEQFPFLIGAEPHIDFQFNLLSEEKRLEFMQNICNNCIGEQALGRRSNRLVKSLKNKLSVKSPTENEGKIRNYSRSYVPNAVIKHCIKIYKENFSKLAPCVETFSGACLMIADISGFTGLNERFAKEGYIGIEKVSMHLNIYMTKMLEVISRYNGDIIKFAGDALIVLFHSDSTIDAKDVTLQAVSCALKLLSDVGLYVTDGIELSLHIAISSGDLYGIHVGGIGNEWEFLITGEPFALIGPALECSKKGDLVVTKETWNTIKSECVGIPASQGKHGEIKVTSIVSDCNVQISDKLDFPKEVVDLIHSYISRPVLEKILSGQNHWLAEFRRASVIFVNLRGLVLNSNSSINLSIPNTVLRGLQRILKKFDGFRRQYLVDDKGSTFICVFGIPPFSHDDDPLRAIRTALKLADFLAHLDISFSIGIATGNVYVGSVGNDDIRREHAVVGDTVNTAARLSGKAEIGEVLIDSYTNDAAKSHFVMIPKGKIKVKGKEKLIDVFEPHEMSTSIAMNKYFMKTTTSPQGRDFEQKQFSSLLLALKQPIPKEKHNRSAFSRMDPSSLILVLEGTSGQGKSHLLRWFRAIATSQKLRNSYVRADEESARAPMSIMKSLIRDLVLFDFKKGDKIEDKIPKSLRSKMQELKDCIINPEPIEGEDKSDRDEVKSFDDTLVEDFCDGILSRFLSDAPILFFIENFQYCDEKTVNYLKKAVLKFHFRMLIVVSMLPLNESSHFSNIHVIASFLKLPVCKKMILHGFSDDTIEQIIREKLKLVKGKSKKSIDILINQIKKSTNGSPYLVFDYIRTMLDERYIRLDESGELILSMEFFAQSSISYSIRKLALERLDNLAPDEQLACKIASILGPRFTKDLFFLISQREGKSLEESQRSLEKLKTHGILCIDSEEFGPEIIRFSQLEFRKTCYDLMLFQRRIDLHKGIISAIEQKQLDWISRIHPRFLNATLAFHYNKLFKSGIKDQNTVSNAISHIVSSAKFSLEYETDMDRVQYLCKQGLLIIEDASVQEFIHKLDSVNIFILFEMSLSCHMKFCHHQDSQASVKNFGEKVAKLCELARGMPSSAALDSFSSYTRLWKLFLHHGFENHVMVILQKITNDMENSKDKVDPSTMLELYRMNIWTYEMYGYAEFSESFLMKALAVLKDDSLDSSISAITKADILSFGSFLFWSKAEHDECIRLSTLCSEVLKTFEHIELRIWGYFHSSIWTYPQAILNQSIENMCSNLRDDPFLLMEDSDADPRTQMISKFVLRPDDCFASETYNSMIWQDILIGFRLQSFLEHSKFDDLLSFLQASHFSLESRSIGMLGFCFDILQARIAYTLLENNLITNSKNALSMVLNCKSRLLRHTKSFEVVGSGSNMRPMLILHLASELAKLLQTWEQWKIDHKFSEAASEFNWGEHMKTLMIAASLITNETIRKPLDDAILYFCSFKS